MKASVINWLEKSLKYITYKNKYITYKFSLFYYRRLLIHDGKMPLRMMMHAAVLIST